MGFSSYARVLWKHKWTIAATTLLTLAIAAFGSSLLPTKYAATVVLRILTPVGGSIDRTEYDIRYGDRLMSTYMEIATSRPVMDELMQQLDLDSPPSIKVEAVANTELLEITASSTEPKLSRDIANTLAEILIARNAELYVGSGKTAAQILGEQLDQIQAELDEARSQYDRLQADNTPNATQLDLIRGLIALKESQYASLLDQYEQVRVADTLRTNAISVVEPAIIPETPAGPSRLLIFGIAGILGLVGGTSLAFAFEYFDTRLYDPEQVESAIGLPVVGKIPKMKRRRKAILFAHRAYHEEAFRRLLVNLFPASLEPNQLTAVKGIGPVYAGVLSRARIYTYRQLAAAKPKELLDLIAAPKWRKVDASSWIEQARHLAAQDGASAHGSLRTLLITSATPAEGKSTIVANLALALAKSGRSVLAVDGDMLLPTLNRVFGLSNAVGLSSVLTGAATLSDAVQDSQIPRIHVLTSGPPVEDRTELLDSPAAKHVIKQAVVQFDVVLIDSPALLAVADAAVLAPLVDAVALVVRRGRSSTETVQDACKILTAVKVNPVGVIMNDMQDSDFRYYRYYHHKPGSNGSRRTAPKRRASPVVDEHALAAQRATPQPAARCTCSLHEPGADLGAVLNDRSLAETS